MGFIHAEDNKATGQKTEQTALEDSSIIPRWELKAILFYHRQTATQALLDLLPSTLLLQKSGVSGLAARTPQLLTTAVDV